MLSDKNPDKIDSGSFVDLLGLRGKTYQSASLDGIIIGVFDYVQEIWRSERLYKFVDHGIDHSFHVLQKSLEIFERVKIENHDLSPYEKTVLGIAALIHDIGMQYEKYQIYNKELNNNQIRYAHVQIGYDIIKKTIGGDFHSKYGGPNLAFPQHHNALLYDGALVGFAHSGRVFWDKLKEPHFSRDTQAGQYRRLRLLASLVRLADELHCEFTRLPELSFIDSPQLDQEGKAHWCACHYIQDVKITSPGPGGVRIRLYWRVPESATEAEIEEILTLLQELREKKINKECSLLQEYFRLSEDSEPCMLDLVLVPDPEFNPAVYNLPEIVSKFIRETIRPYQFGSKQINDGGIVNEIQCSPGWEYVKKDSKDYFLRNPAIKSGHFILKTGWHTDRLVNCRELCSDIDFITNLCSMLSKEYSEYGFTDILAIGTSAIGIASLLSLMLNAKLSFTFESVIEKSKGKGHYSKYERGIPQFKGNNLLIIDDILGVGSVLDKIVSLINSKEKPPSFIHSFCLFSLGKTHTPHGFSDKISVDYLVSFPDVQYWKEKDDTSCEECKQMMSY